MKGPAIFLAQFAGTKPPFDKLETMASSDPMAAPAFTAATKAGSIGPAAFRSPGDGQIDFTRIFSKFAQYGYEGWAVLEWECCLKHPEDGAREGAPFIRRHMIRRAPHAFDDFAASSTDPKVHASILGLDQ